MTKKQKKVLYRIIVAAVLWIVCVCLPVDGWLRFGLFMIPYVIIGYDILRKAIIGICNKEIFDENFLMAVATVGAILLGEYFEATAVMLFYQIGELFQSVAVGKSRKNIAALMDIRPDYANVEGENGELEQVDPDEVAVGTMIVVKPGERIPLDGQIIEGTSSLNTSALTGESMPREVFEGDNVSSGCVNISGLLKIVTTKEFGESTVSKILELVENSGMRKSKSENFISKFAHYYTPAVCYAALALTIIPPVINMFVMGGGPEWSKWLIRALTFLVISCPCALVISIPLSFFGGIGGASAQGILIKGSNYLETLAKTEYVVLDKTGTLTKGTFEVIKVQTMSDKTQEEVLKLAAYAECYSNHPISKSLVEAWEKEGNPNIDKGLVNKVEEISGHGLCAMVGQEKVAVGNIKLMNLQGISTEQPKEEGTIVYVAVNGEYAGYIVIADALKEQAKEAMEQLKKIGIKKLVMLTGDIKNVAERIARSLGMDEVKSELLPEQKVKQVEALLKEKTSGRALAFVGDGINDAPVLTRADIGIAMGAMGSDAAIEAADVVLMDDNPLKIAQAIKISRKCLRIVYENIIFALGIKAVCLVLGAMGIANMWLAIFADVGVMVLAVLNAIRCLHVEKE
ncbi:MAG: cadmium-translocating P-type ATPase [Lachnospiraceae bacterium]|nr:cadmium-translocating P-type ATPase [Lachnospiraceae bacterium]